VLAHVGFADRHPDLAVIAAQMLGSALPRPFRRSWAPRSRSRDRGGGADDETAPIDLQRFDLPILCHGLHPPHLSGRAQDGALDARIGHAAAEVAVHVRNDFGLGGSVFLASKVAACMICPDWQWPSGKKIITIEGLDPKGEHPLQRAWIAEQVPQCGLRYGGLAGAHRLAVEVDGAGAAQAGATAEICADHLQMLADDPQQRRFLL
jgi:hypothetical protein